MKNTKKHIMVPEVEYQALLNMLKGSDELGYDKATIDTNIHKLLNDPKISTLVKGKKYDWLVKQKQDIRKKMDERASRPQKVEIDKEQIQSILQDISKYLGVAPTQPTTQQPQKQAEPIISSAQKKRQKRKAAQNQPSPIKTETEGPESESEIEGSPRNIVKQSTSKQGNYIIHPNYRGDFVKILKGYKTRLKINKDNQLLNDEGLTIQGSDLDEILDYMVGRTKVKPPGTQILIDRMKNEPYYKKALDWAEEHRQKGEGFANKFAKERTSFERIARPRQRFKMPAQLYKTKGLVRKNPKTFKPLIWAKL
jgi:hypothetical protein